MSRRFAKFDGADLSEAAFIASDFNNCLLRGAILAPAKFERCKLSGADLTGSRSLNVHFDETLLINAKLPEYAFRKKPLNKLDFGQADLQKCDFREAVFCNCSLREAYIESARFDGADLRGADLGGVGIVDASVFRARRYHRIR